MRITDAHTHLLAPAWVPLAVRMAWARQAATRRLPEKQPSEILPRVVVGQSDPHGSLTLAALERAGVAAAMVPVIDWTLAALSSSRTSHLVPGDGDLPIEEVNRLTAAACADSGGRLYHCPGVDPRHANASDLVTRVLAASTARGLKVYPATGWQVDAPEHGWLFEALLERDLPALVHTAALGGDPLITPLSRPSALAPLLARYPQLKLVMAHAGFEAWWLEAADIASGWAQTYLELSLWQSLANRSYSDFRCRVSLLVERIGAHRIIFASDTLRGPVTDPDGRELSNWVGQFLSLAEPYQGSPPVLSTEQLELVMGGNAARVYRIEA